MRSAFFDNPASYAFRTREDWKKEIAKLLTPDSLILDTETTGTGSDARMIELSIVSTEGELLYNQLFATGEPLPEVIPGITGITDEMLSDQPHFEAEAERIAEIIRSKKLIGWNVSFDKRIVENEFASAGKLALLSPAGWEDAMELYSLSQGKAKKWCKLIKAKEEMEIGESQEHRATADCMDTLAVMRRASGLDKSKTEEQEDLLSALGEDLEEVDFNDL